MKHAAWTPPRLLSTFLRSACLGILAVIFLGLAAAAPFEDASLASIYGTQLTSYSPWIGSPPSDVGVVDLDADGFEEILISGDQETCSGNKIKHTAVFVRDPMTHVYVQVEAFQTTFFGLEVLMSKFEPISRFGSSVPDLVACDDLSSSMTLVENHGSFNFSLKSFPPTACSSYSTVEVLDDSDDGLDEVIIFSSFDTTYWSRLSNSSFVLALSRFSGGPPPVLYNPIVAFGDLDSDSYVDMIFSGSDSSYDITILVYRNDGHGNFSNATATSRLPGVQYGFVEIAEFTGDEKLDVLLGGSLANNTIASYLFKNNGSMSFEMMGDIGFEQIPYFSKAVSVPLRSQTNGWDIVVVSNQFTYQAVFVYINDGSGFFTRQNQTWISLQFQGSVIRGPDLGTSPTFLAVGFDDINTYDSSTICGYYDSGDLQNALSTMFGTRGYPSSISAGGVISMNFNYDHCMDAFVYGSDRTIVAQSVLLVGDCSGAFKPYAYSLPVLYPGSAAAEDFDHDGLVDVLLIEYSIGAVVYSFDANGVPFQQLSAFPSGAPTTQYSHLCTGHSSGFDYSDIFSCGTIFTPASASKCFYMRNARNSSFLMASSMILGLVDFAYGSCAFVDKGDSPDAGLWKDIFVVGYNSTMKMAFYANDRNGTISNRGSSSAFFPGGSPQGCSESSMVAADFNGDLRDDLFYNGQSSICTIFVSYLYLRMSNGSFVLGSGLAAVQGTTNLYRSSTVTVDIDGDGDVDLFVAGAMTTGTEVLAALFNDGTGNFTDGSALVFGTLPGFQYGGMAVAQFTNDSMLDLINSGRGSFCGPRVLLQNSSSEASSSSSSSSPSTSGSSSANIGAIAGGLAGGLGFLLLCAVCCVIVLLSCCCLLCMLAIIFAAAAVVGVVVLAVFGLSLFTVGDAGVIFYLVRGRGRKDYTTFNLNGFDTTALIAEAQNTNNFNVIPWEEIHTVRKLGAGAFGEVLLGEWNGVEVAVKMFRNPSEEAIDEFQHEALMMAKVSHHPNVVNFIGASFPAEGMAMVLGLCVGGSLLSALEKRKLDAVMKTRVLGEVASALGFLHSLGIVHRDIAARNVLLDGSGKAKLADLGLSRLLENKQSDQKTASYVGPVRWMAPEAISERLYSTASDCYSFGVLMSEVWADGATPYADVVSVADVAIAVLQHGAHPRISPETPLDQAELMQRLFSADPAERPSMEILRRALQPTNGSRSDIDDAGSSRSGTEYVPFSAETD